MDCFRFDPLVKGGACFRDFDGRNVMKILLCRCFVDVWVFYCWYCFVALGESLGLCSLDSFALTIHGVATGFEGM